MDKSKVYFTKEITEESLIRIYEDTYFHMQKKQALVVESMNQKKYKILQLYYILQILLKKFNHYYKITYVGASIARPQPQRNTLKIKNEGEKPMISLANCWESIYIYIYRKFIK